MIEAVQPPEVRPLTHAAALAVRNAPVRRWIAFQRFKVTARRAAHLSASDPEFYSGGAADVILFSCRTSFSFMGDRLSEVEELATTFWSECDLLINENRSGMSKAPGELEEKELSYLESDKIGLSDAGDPASYYTAKCLEILNQAPQMQHVASGIANIVTAGGMGSR
ncbi:hypothetical protein IHE71_09505 [Myceligenerans sp. TRM 65318]|uniref:Uncharacterized protein n=1 Tax=Myceligenerans pegani TaxID=2776917 RepID=A0ABR9MX26_9MICO|nr:hypothetical protein [Myceligenerans sp. TRM 65318]MBE1875945.1 hypothetical protein [Myceligenerans sp. TRM 65318]